MSYDEEPRTDAEAARLANLRPDGSHVVMPGWESDAVDEADEAVIEAAIEELADRVGHEPCAYTLKATPEEVLTHLRLVELRGRALPACAYELSPLPSGAFDPTEATSCCGYPIGEHVLGGPCPDEASLAYKYGY